LSNQNREGTIHILVTKDMLLKQWVFMVPFLLITSQFDLSAFTPNTYKFIQTSDGKEDNNIHIMVNHLTTSKTSKKNNHNIYDFFNKHIHMCKSDQNSVVKAQENLGSILLGDRIYELPYTQSEETVFGVDKFCQKICSSSISTKDADFINGLIVDNYQYQWFIDDLPLGSHYTLKHNENDEESVDYYSNSFGVGIYDDKNEGSDFYKKPLIFNHFDIIIEYSTYDVLGSERIKDNTEYVIVATHITPYSIHRNEYKDTNKAKKNYCSFTGQPKELLLDKETDIDYTVSIKYVENKTILFKNRWDKYLALQKMIISNDWNNILILLAINLVLSLTIYKLVMWNMNKYKQQNAIEKTLDMEFDEDQGWKLLLGDIYRQPNKLSLLCTLVGTGIQTMVTALLISFLGASGILPMGDRGLLATASILVFSLLPFITSFTSMKLYLMYEGRLFKRNMTLNCCLVPLFVFALLLLTNISNVIKLPSHIHSPSVIPLKTLFVFIPIWLVLYIPSSVLGSVVAKKTTDTEKQPRKVNKIQRLIPAQPLFSKMLFLCILVSALPFSSVFLVIKHTFGGDILVSGLIPKDQFVLISVSLIVVAYNCFIMGVIITYSLLIFENWKWSWKVFMTLFVGMFTYTFVYGCFIIDAYHNIVKYLALGLLLGLICGSFSFLGGIVCVKKMFNEKTSAPERLA